MPDRNSRFHTTSVDTGVIGIAGKVILDEGVDQGLPKVFLEGAALVAAPGGFGMFIEPQIFDHAHAVKASVGGNDSHYDPGAEPLFDNTKSYVMWALSGRQRALLPGDSVLAPGHASRRRDPQHDAVSRYRSKYRITRCGALSGALSAANRDEEDVLRSIHTYETNMIRYGFRAVRESLKAMESTLDDRPFVRAVNRTAFKAPEALPPIKKWVFGHVGDER